MIEARLLLYSIACVVFGLEVGEGHFLAAFFFCFVMVALGYWVDLEVKRLTREKRIEIKRVQINVLADSPLAKPAEKARIESQAFVPYGFSPGDSRLPPL
jgi:hypothetical protein